MHQNDWSGLCYDFLALYGGLCCVWNDIAAVGCVPPLTTTTITTKGCFFLCAWHVWDRDVEDHVGSRTTIRKTRWARRTWGLVWSGLVWMVASCWRLCSGAALLFHWPKRVSSNDSEKKENSALYAWTLPSLRERLWFPSSHAMGELAYVALGRSRRLGFGRGARSEWDRGWAAKGFLA